jgi:hypothetical protein
LVLLVNSIIGVEVDQSAGWALLKEEKSYLMNYYGDV